jgi:hypothetical protein
MAGYLPVASVAVARLNPAAEQVQQDEADHLRLD